ncbi:hypothetical protein J4417_00185 [Candidatus Woesearchaeota archaeon]|nr:hypothetical protein [Candidatus Woesearchaeota archaeon]
MTKKRGQVTMFIIIGGVIVLTLVLILSLIGTRFKHQNEVEDTIYLNAESEKIKMTLDKCLKKVSGKALLNLGYFGGRDTIFFPYFEGEMFNANYGHYLGADTTPSTEEMEEYLAEMIEEHLPSCATGAGIKNYSVLNGNGLNKNIAYLTNVQIGKLETTAKIGEQTVLFQVNWPIKIIQGTSEREVAFFEINHKIKLKELSLFVQNLTLQIQEHPFFIDPLALLHEGYFIDAALFNKDTYLFLITDNQSKIESQPIRFLFAAKINAVEEQK